MTGLLQFNKKKHYFEKYSIILAVTKKKRNKTKKKVCLSTLSNKWTV